MGLNKGLKSRIATVLSIMKGVLHIAFIPTILYLGFSQGAEPGMPELSLLNLLWQIFLAAWCPLHAFKLACLPSETKDSVLIIALIRKYQ